MKGMGAIDYEVAGGPSYQRLVNYMIAGERHQPKPYCSQLSHDYISARSFGLFIFVVHELM